MKLQELEPLPIFYPSPLCNIVDTLFKGFFNIFYIDIDGKQVFYLICIKKRNFVSINPFDFLVCLKTFAPAYGHPQK